MRERLSPPEDALTALRSRLETLFQILQGTNSGRTEPFTPQLHHHGRWAGTESLREPAMEWLETSANLILRLQMPGALPDSIELESQGTVLTLSGKIEASPRAIRGAKQCPSRFERIVPLPFRVDPQQVEAVYENGILEVTIPKNDPTQSKKRRGIPINAYYKF